MLKKIASASVTSKNASGTYLILPRHLIRFCGSVSIEWWNTVDRISRGPSVFFEMAAIRCSIVLKMIGEHPCGIVKLVK